MTPIIYKHAAPIMPMLKTLGSKLMPLGKKLVSAPTSATGRLGFWAKPHLAMPAVGAGVGAISNVKQQLKDIQSGAQGKFDWKRFGVGTGIGAGVGLGASYIKPINNVWTKGFRTKGALKGTTEFSVGESQAFLAANPTYARRIATPKLFSKDYFRSIGQDFKHPVQSIKAMGTDLKYGYRTTKDGAKIIHKRSPVGMAAAGAMNVGLPASFALGTARNKDMSAGEKAVRIGTLGASYLTPKFLPSMALWSAPGMIYKKKPPVTMQAPQYE